MFSFLDLISLPESQGGFGPDWIHGAVRDLFAVDPWHDGAAAPDPERACCRDVAVCCK